ncbi:MAG: putative esterase [Phycisphaerae bacterium]|nr:putative esterase [Phycisphaerae bacterium]
MAVFHHQVIVEFSDTDAAGVVHFSNYLRFMERVEHAFWRSLGRSVITEATDAHISFPRVRAECDYLLPARFEDVIDAALTVENIGTKSVSFRVEFSLRGRAIARGRMVAVCCRMLPRGKLESIEIPEMLRKPMERFVAEAPPA